jgi:hypothetical protein
MTEQKAYQTALTRIPSCPLRGRCAVRSQAHPYHPPSAADRVRGLRTPQSLPRMPLRLRQTLILNCYEAQRRCGVVYSNSADY